MNFVGSNQYRTRRVFGVCVCVLFILGTAKGSIDSGSGEAGDRLCNRWFTKHNAYLLHLGDLLLNIHVNRFNT